MPSVAENLKEIKNSIPEFSGRIIAVTKYVKTAAILNFRITAGQILTEVIAI